MRIEFRNIGTTFRARERKDNDKQLKAIYECPECGCAVSNPELHQKWHLTVVRCNTDQDGAILVTADGQLIQRFIYPEKEGS